MSTEKPKRRPVSYNEVNDLLKLPLRHDSTDGKHDTSLSPNTKKELASVAFPSMKHSITLRPSMSLGGSQITLDAEPPLPPRNRNHIESTKPMVLRQNATRASLPPYTRNDEIIYDNRDIGGTLRKSNTSSSLNLSPAMPKDEESLYSRYTTILKLIYFN